MQKSKSMSDAEKARALARFAHLRGRGVELQFQPRGRVVKASTPDDLQAAVKATRPEDAPN